MKTKLMMSVLLLGVLFIQNAYSVKVTKTWEFGDPDRRTWRVQEIDDWGGVNSWCVDPGSSCGEWDWKAEYNRVLANPTPQETNTPEYGLQLVQEAASAQQIVLPPDLPIPEFNIIEEPDIE